MKGNDKEFMNNRVNSLDLLRREKNTKNFKNAFVLHLDEQRNNTIRILNDRNLCFPSLYLLIPEIESNDLVGHLTMQNKIAIQICHTILGNCRQEDFNQLASDRKLKQILRWMFQTGIEIDGLDDRYDLVLDGVVSLLIIDYQDSTILSSVTDLIFNRNMKGALIHDLVWSLYQSYDRSIYKFVGNYLKWSDPSCVKLACKLLNFIPSQCSIDNKSLQNHHDEYQTWFDENESFLYFTGESLQLTSHPAPCKVNLEGKYLNKKVSPIDGKLIKPISDLEKEYLEHFHHLTNNKKKLLSSYSQKLYKKDVKLWKQWMRCDLHKQIEMATQKLEGDL